jgi:hypothetical protein
MPVLESPSVAAGQADANLALAKKVESGAGML